MDLAGLRANFPKTYPDRLNGFPEICGRPTG